MVTIDLSNDEIENVIGQFLGLKDEIKRLHPDFDEPKQERMALMVIVTRLNLQRQKQIDEMQGRLETTLGVVGTAIETALQAIELLGDFIVAAYNGVSHLSGLLRDVLVKHHRIKK